MKKKRIFGYIRVGLTPQQRSMLTALTSETGVSDQQWITNTIALEFNKGGRSRPKIAPPEDPDDSEQNEEDPEKADQDRREWESFRDKVLDKIPYEELEDEHGKRVVQMTPKELKAFVFKKARELDIPVPGEDYVPQDNSKPLKELATTTATAEEYVSKFYGFQWRMSPVLKRKVWGRIMAVPKHLVDAFDKKPDQRLLKTKADVIKAKKELEEINAWVAKKKKELDKKYGEGTAKRAAEGLRLDLD